MSTAIKKQPRLNKLMHSNQDACDPLLPVPLFLQREYYSLYPNPCSTNKPCSFIARLSRGNAVTPPPPFRRLPLTRHRKEKQITNNQGN